MIYDILLDFFFNNWHTVLLFFTVAFLYSSVGFGGGSSYLAILALTGIVLLKLEQQLYYAIL